tara:strand:- start:53 stop:1267 length:1215 start_codon:yes stop_codon:yes gene_type:complete
MAPKRERPLTSIPTIDNNPDRLFRVWQRLGRMPRDYSSFDDVGKEFLRLVKVEGLTKDEARAKLLGSEDNWKNVIGQHYLDITQSSEGKFRGINYRSIREDVNVVEELAIRTIYSDAFYDDFTKYLKTQWDRTAKLDIKKINKHLEAFGKTGRGRWHRGHGFSAKEDGAGVSTENVKPEIGTWNVSHGPAPRFSKEIMRDLNMSVTDLQALYDRQLKMEGLDINPRMFNELFVAADEARRYPGDPAVRFNENQLEMMNQKLFQLQQQGEPSAKLERFARNQSFLLDNTTAESKSGPVRVLRPADIVKDARGRIRFGNILDKSQLAEHLFNQGQTGSQLDQLTQQADDSGMLELTVGDTAIGRNDPFTDVGANLSRKLEPILEEGVEMQTESAEKMNISPFQGLF